MMIDDGLDDGVTALRQEARRQDPAIMVRAALLRRSCDRLGGKHVFQCFSSDPKTRVFECFWASLSILDGKNVFQCFWSDPKTRVFESFSEVLYCFCHRLGSLYTRFTQTLQER